VVRFSATGGTARPARRNAAAEHGGGHGRGALLALALIALIAGAGRASAREPLPLARVDMSRVWGDWYIIATIPNAFERGMVAPHDVYSPGGGRNIQEDFYMRRGGFGARLNHFRVHDWVRAETNNAHWRVQIFWPINLPFLVVYVDPQYRFMLFGEEDRKLGWIYGRSPEISDADYADLLRRFAAAGYDPARFRKFVQTPAQIGQPGFWSDGVRVGLGR
jgi:apolipoprotein D and lipocalin family protein